MYDQDFFNEYYEKYHSLERKLTLIEDNRIKSTINLIPEDVESLLEVGCGDGRIINRLQGKYKKICGLDISINALENVETPKIQGSIENLPFSDNSFDIVICAEVLEHLPHPIYQKAIEELERVSKKYILISVPDNENLNDRMIKCPKCGCSSHEWRHLRSFDKEKLKTLFDDFEIHKTKNEFADEYVLTNTFFKIGKCFNYYRKFPETATCPQCGYFSEKKSKSTNQSEKRINLLKKILPLKKTSFWMILLYKYSR